MYPSSHTLDTEELEGDWLSEPLSELGDASDCSIAWTVGRID